MPSPRSAEHTSDIKLALPDRPHVLIVDDDVDFATELLDLLELSGVAGEHVESLRAARRRMEERPPDVLLLDRYLNDENGLALCQDIKSRPTSWFLPIIGVSGDACQRARLEAVKLGVDHWCVKPVDVEELVARIHILVRGAACARALVEKADLRMFGRDWVRYLVHDMRNHLGAAFGNLDLVLSELPEGVSGDLQAALAESRHAIGTVTGMLRDLLDTERLERGLLEIRPSDVDLAALAREAGEGSALSLREDLEVTVLAPEPVLVRADPGLLRRILSNLVGNGARYARSAVTIEAFATPATAALRVANDGPAVPADLVDDLFRPWVSTRRHTGQGAGLGLAFCRLAVGAHEGTVSLECNQDGAVVFRIDLPR